MRIVRFLDENGVLRHGNAMAQDRCNLLEGDPFSGLRETGRQVAIKKLLPPVQPPAIFCIGLNYREHAGETRMELPDYPVLFMKNPASITGHGDSIVLPPSCLDPLQVDYEVELAVVIGKQGRNIPRAKALSHIAGFTVSNDVSARTWQFSAGGGQWIRGKSFDTFCPLGPELVTVDEVSDIHNLDLTCTLNGEIMQQGNTSRMIFPVDELIAYLSEDTTLLPGTVILTGTPSGVGFTRNPPVFLKPGDIIEMTVEKVGTLRNSVVAG